MSDITVKIDGVEYRPSRGFGAQLNSAVETYIDHIYNSGAVGDVLDKRFYID